MKKERLKNIMGIIVTLVKIWISIFPFLSELFLLSSKKKGSAKTTIGGVEIPEKWKPLIRRAVIIVGLVSFILAIFLSRRLWDLSVEIERLRKAKQVVTQSAQAEKDKLPKAKQTEPIDIGAPEHDDQNSVRQQDNKFSSPSAGNRRILNEEKDTALIELKRIQRTFNH